MNNQKLTKRVVDATHSNGKGQTFIWDTELKGFGLLITPIRKTYVAQSRVDGKTVRVTIGLRGHLTPVTSHANLKNLSRPILGETNSLN